ncbi:MAG: transposase family protein [Anaerolineae bacterium]|nr:transposase family protein [Anaerolineae bacterium]
MHHSDQGSQYTSHDFLALLQQYDIQVSMSGVGNCYDTAMMESFFATSKLSVSTSRLHLGNKHDKLSLSTLRFVQLSATSFGAGLSQP